MYENLLKNLSVSAEETQLYFAMLSSTGITAGDLAKQTGLPRPSVYTILTRLINKGLVTESQKEGKKFLSLFILIR